MIKIIILGANGFIGKALAASLKNKKEYEIITHSRFGSTDINYPYCSNEFKEVIEKMDIVINSTGVGLSKLYVSSTTNEELTYNIFKNIKKFNNKIKIIHLSSIKAFNPLKYDDIYSNDKAKAEEVFKKLEIDKNTCIVRLPIITGRNDPNFYPFFSLLRNLKLPILKTSTPSLNIISLKSVENIIISIINDNNTYLGKVIYISNSNQINWNQLITCLSKPLCSININFMYIIWKILSVNNIFSKKRKPFPKERFYDLFIREWHYDYSENNIILKVEENVEELLKELYYEKNI